LASRIAASEIDGFEIEVIFEMSDRDNGEGEPARARRNCASVIDVRRLGRGSSSEESI
jgi:hypothetical protein